MNSVEIGRHVDTLGLQALRQDDEKALQFLFTTYYNPLVRVGVKQSHDSALTKEAIQSVFRTFGSIGGRWAT